MNALSRHSRRIGPLVAGLLLLSLTTSTLARDDDVKVPFLFTEDEKLVQTELREAVPRSSTLPADQFLNAPMTRLEYMLTTLEARLNEESWKSLIHDRLAEAFDQKSSKFNVPVSIKGFARYAPELGRIFVGYTVAGLGQPRKPMRTTCDELLSQLKPIAPQGNMGFLYHNTVLGVLAQKDYAEYTPILETLAKSVVHRVTLESKTGDLGVVHGLACQRTEEGGHVLYHRFSFKVGSLR